jgi:uncharacterized protein
MNRTVYKKIEAYMLECMKDGAHDKEHIYRVLYYALDISENYTVDTDVLIASALLHDIGRDAQYKNPELDHARIGSEMAYDYLIKSGWNKDKAEHVKKCISTHRYRNTNKPESIEAKILFDSDKLDVTGAVGIARTLAYIGIVGEPVYSLDCNREILDGTKDTEPSFFQEYNFKLKKLYDGFYTERAKELAVQREGTARKFYEALLEEVREPNKKGNKILAGILDT